MASQSKGQPVTGEAPTRRSLCSESTCTNHFRRHTSCGSCDAHKDTLDLSVPGLAGKKHTPHGAPSVSNSHLEAIKSQSTVRAIGQLAYLFACKPPASRISKALGYLVWILLSSNRHLAKGVSEQQRPRVPPRHLRVKPGARK